jgi:type II secretory pathway pseudopilin PulG
MSTQMQRGSKQKSVSVEYRDQSGRGGFTLLELSIFMSVILVAFLTLSQSIVASMRLTETNRERRLATNGAREMIERLYGVEDFDTIFLRFNDNPADDAGQVAPGSGFAIAGLMPVSDDPDGMVGEIVFPTIGFELLENVDDLALGMPRDLNGDGAVDALDHSADYRLLPVALRLRWQGAGGQRTLEVRTLLADR